MNDTDFRDYADSVERSFQQLERDSSSLSRKLIETRCLLKGLAMRSGISPDQWEELEEFVRIECSRELLNIRNKEDKL